MASRAQNERKFQHWEELPNGVEDIFAILPVALAGALGTSKKWIQPKERLVSRRKSSIDPAAL